MPSGLRCDHSRGFSPEHVIEGHESARTTHRPGRNQDSRSVHTGSKPQTGVGGIHVLKLKDFINPTLFQNFKTALPDTVREDRDFGWLYRAPGPGPGFDQPQWPQAFNRLQQR